MQLMSEIVHNTRPVIEEGVDGKKTMYIEGIFMQDSIKNRNGRVYPKDVMTESVTKYVDDYVKTNRAMGELNHPSSPQVNPERASHLIVSLKESGNDWIGRAKVLDTPMGAIVRNLIEGGVQLGVSSRGLGAIKESKEGNVVQRGFMLTAVDTVSDPSAPSAFINGIMEGKEWILENGVLKEKQMEEVQDYVDSQVRKRAFDDAKMTALFHKIITNL